MIELQQRNTIRNNNDCGNECAQFYTVWLDPRTGLNNLYGNDRRWLFLSFHLNRVSDIIYMEQGHMHTPQREREQKEINRSKKPEKRMREMQHVPKKTNDNKTFFFQVLLAFWYGNTGQQPAHTTVNFMSGCVLCIFIGFVFFSFHFELRLRSSG